MIRTPLLTRRAFLRAAVAAATLPWLTAIPAWAGDGHIRPRSEWGADLPPKGPLELEAEGDVKFLLVHHSATPNNYAEQDVPQLLRSFYSFHTGNKGWADVAYNFFIDRYGGVWEGRTGSMAGPVRGDATGGSQGHALLCCLVGDHTTEPPTEAAVHSMAVLLASLCHTYGIDASPEATTTFTSRGSNRWPAGTTVTAPTICAHRDMSNTSCPGDAGYRMVTESLRPRVFALWAPEPEADPTAANASPTQRSTPSEAGAQEVPRATTPAAPATPAPPSPSSATPQAVMPGPSPVVSTRPAVAAPDEGADGADWVTPLILGVTSAAATAAIGSTLVKGNSQNRSPSQ
ncbi:MAG TPA: N-acetylmuramoyl-L-alanine amidase [Nocardioidaceae bacterium]|nr:N-acetylmuramoyl-L-alanine amidase [Nocardioidaceae bacterium]